MTREQLEHAIRAACHIAEDSELIVIGSQAILAQFPDAATELRLSRELDVYPKNRPDRSDIVDGVLGELSQFDELHGFYVHGIGPETATLPDGWEQRLVPVSVRDIDGARYIGWCLDVHDVAASKLVPARDKDLDFVTGLLRHGMIDQAELRSRIAALKLPLDDRSAIGLRFEAIIRRVKQSTTETRHQPRR